ncbi:MAG TPA: metallophosphoesterase [Prolixibacteraceae bacterium]|nr:metallophosphoesterase [Prolixibacteraceae bacterium]
MYDIIGDVHGHADQLKSLLKKMGYKLTGDFYSHRDRKAVFVGDFINRGPKIRETILIIRKMVENGSAYAILGNHEMYAVLYYLRDIEGKYYKKRIPKYQLQINQTLDEFVLYKEEFKSHLKWMRTLPMFLDFGDIRVVHACWDDESIELIKDKITEPKLSKTVLREIALNGTEFSEKFWETCKGIDFQLPKDLLVFDEEGRPHRSFRMKWWADPEGMTFNDISLESRFALPAYTIPKEIITKRKPYSPNDPIVFFGHYCLNQCCGILTENLCCVDSCVTRTGKLLAYRWDGKKVLKKDNFIFSD